MFVIIPVRYTWVVQPNYWMKALLETFLWEGVSDENVKDWNYSVYDTYHKYFHSQINT